MINKHEVINKNHNHQFYCIPSKIYSLFIDSCIFCLLTQTKDHGSLAQIKKVITKIDQ